jgi:hypothetical protein
MRRGGAKGKAMKAMLLYADGADKATPGRARRRQCHSGH